MAGYEGQYINNSIQLGLISVSDDVYHHYGATAKNLVKPAGSQVTSLVVMAESGTFRYKLGDHDTTLTYAEPSASVTDGSGTLKLAEGQQLAFTAPQNITFIGDSATAVLTYYWV